MDCTTLDVFTKAAFFLVVEYHDPSGIFPIVSRDLAARLPLRNLNWQSPPRPLRQIRSLHVDFVPDKPTQGILKPQLSRTDSNGPDSLDIVRSGGKSTKERRHQIPGFKTSPYLKIYILRCDDKEAYKENDRNKIKEWLKEIVVPEGKRGAEHDACEWLILHVVIPDTVAASEPRWRESARDPDELKERKGGTKWPGQSSRTVLDRLRADFNETGKSAKDRITQIRLVKGQMPADLLPTPAAATTLEESAQERENAWNDLIAKFKTLILGPFDRRVRQYEADIAEQEARRALPGFNFCTFFIHKEGLAKALESIGLVEDALAIYDELSLGLETVCREIAEGKGVSTATSFAAYTDDVKDRISGVKETQTNGHDDDLTTNDAAILFSKDYRERILRSDISVFDFMCYLYHRQKALILRLANSKSSRVELGASPGREGGEDLVLTSEVCWRASIFIHTAARALRQDISSGHTANKSSTLTSAGETDSAVCSWVWAVAGQVLEQTAAPALLDATQQDAPRPSAMPNGTLKRPDLSIGLGANSHPQRSASLPGTKHDSLEPADTLTRPKTQGERPPSRSGLNPNRPTGLPGQAELATYRAELVMMRRKMLEQLAARRRWYAGWSSAKRGGGNRDAGPDNTVQPTGLHSSTTDILTPALKTILESEVSFQARYEDLTMSAIQHYLAATQKKIAERLMGDLAALKCQQNDNAAAAAYFQRIIPQSNPESWESVEGEVLRTYCICLKDLERREDYVRVALALVTKSVAKKAQRGGWRLPVGGSLEGEEMSALWRDAIAASAGFKEEDDQPLRKFFEGVRLNQEVVHQHADGFGLSLELTHALDGKVEFDEASVRLVGVDDPTLVVLANSIGPIEVVPGKNRIELTGTVVTTGAFLVDKIVLSAQKLRFVEELRPEPAPTPLGFTGVVPPTVTILAPSKVPPFVYLYQSEHAFVAEIKRSSYVHIDKRRHLSLSLHAGQSSIASFEVRLKPTSAGLRLYLADATVKGIETASSADAKPGQINLASLEANDAAHVLIPFTVEHANRDIAVRLEILYRTEHGTFTFLHAATISNELTLDVDVNDLFQLDTLISNFTVRTMTTRPFSVLDAQLQDSPVYAVEAPPCLPLPMDVYKSQPVNLVYKITRKPVVGQEVFKRDAALALDVTYLPTDELLDHCLRGRFSEDLRTSPFSALHRLLTPLLLSRFRQSLQNSDLEMATIIGESRLPSFDAIGWEELVGTLPLETRKTLLPWLREWHTQHTTLATAGNEASAKEAAQHITISVDVPNVDVVFSASLNLLDMRPAIGPHTVMVKIGQPIHAKLRIRSTKQWSAKSIFPNVPSVRIHGDGQDQSTFVLDIAADAETWLLGGQRRHHFIWEAEEMVVDVLLIPLRLGLHALPAIEVQQPSSDVEGGSDGNDAVSVSCETHYESAGKMVRAVRDTRISRVHIAEAAAVAGVEGGSRPGTASTGQAV